QRLIDLARSDAPRVLSMLATRFRDLDLADDAVQEALVRAATSWPARGVPDEPAAWLHTVARRVALDMLRRRASAQRRLERSAPELAQASGSQASQLESSNDMTSDLLDDEGDDPGDERLRLLVLCCHPALGVEVQVALTLRLVGGLTTDEIAAAFLVPSSTLGQRISRAKNKIRTAGIPMSLPEDIGERLPAVLGVLYLTFNEGYLSRADHDTAMRVDLAEEAIRLCQLVCDLVPDEPEPLGLLAMMRFAHARRDARFDEGLVLLHEQDRSRWRLDEIGAGNAALQRAMGMMKPGPFQLQAVIASHHANARTAEDTDWPRIVALYDQLEAIQPSPVVQLNRAVALAMADGPLVGLDALDQIDGLDSYHLANAARGELLQRLGRHTEAAVEFERARELTSNPAELDHLAGLISRPYNG
ncbi:MAG: RNA polymerase sigma factor, partial [Ilumatobacter sp.]